MIQIKQHFFYSLFISTSFRNRVTCFIRHSSSALESAVYHTCRFGKCFGDCCIPSKCFGDCCIPSKCFGDCCILSKCFGKCFGNCCIPSKCFGKCFGNCCIPSKCFGKCFGNCCIPSKCFGKCFGDCCIPSKCFGKCFGNCCIPSKCFGNCCIPSKCFGQLWKEHCFSVSFPFHLLSMRFPRKQPMDNVNENLASVDNGPCAHLYSLHVCAVPFPFLYVCPLKS